MTWYVLTVTPRQERFVRDAVTELRDDRGELLNLGAYYPLHITQAKWARRIVTRSRPLMPGYLFVEMPDRAPWAAVRAIRGVRGYVGGAEGPRAVPEAEIGRLIAKEANHEFDETWKREPDPAKPRRYTRRFKVDRVDIEALKRALFGDAKERQIARTQDIAQLHAA
jgi:transcription antitermination factor NusG